ncbi:DUF1634 domain-containing protein [Mucilaginibacter sp.]|uniref:DUF1634 domain-containing protein n=1 Tax=Mucilaginibacter sp. TaxID=1882438 RepID=UPI00284721F3|nr:DUF1634 domain-containing protein [Mucilaginibacter sp.]MDR3695371.1 DUF1634 domain-containing protein [Mucilaginibacter sp.]
MIKFKDRDMQSLLGQVLRAGTVISISVVFIGGMFYLTRHGQSIANYKVFNGIPDFVQSPTGIMKGIFNLKGQAIIQFGIVLLIATPIVRVIFSAVGFILEKDYMYVAISLLVLSIIFFSMMTGKAG